MPICGNPPSGFVDFPTVNGCAWIRPGEQANYAWLNTPPVISIGSRFGASFQSRTGDISPEFLPLVQKIEATRPYELFPGAVLLAGGLTTLGLAAAGAPALLTGALSTLSRQVQPMAFNIAGLTSGILGSAAQAFGGFNPALGAVAQFGSGIASAFAPQPTQFLPQPVAQQFGMGFGAQATPVAQRSPIPVGPGAMSAVRAAVLPILIKIAQTLGTRAIPSLTKALNMIRSLGKALLSPQAIAVALGITVDELARLIVASRQVKRRRMNVSNSKALRRSLRRVEGFHRLCVRVDTVRGSARRRSRRRSCVKCHRSPCICV